MEERQLQLINLDPNSLVENPWNPNSVSSEKMERLRNSIKIYGTFKPNLVRKLSDGSYQILGGKHRNEIYKEMGYKTVQCLVLGDEESVPADKAKAISILDNERFGSDDSLKLSQLLSTLDDSGLDLKSVMPFDDIQLDSLLDLAKIDMERIETGFDDSNPIGIEIPEKTHQIVRFKIPTKDIESFDSLIETTIKNHSLNEKDSLTNGGDAILILLGLGN